MTPHSGGRKLKKQLEALLLSEPFDKALEGLSDWPERQSINVIVSFFCSLNMRLKWRAVSAAGTVVSRLFESSPEEARIIMRRLMWMLNEESGGIGWGVPEAMGDIMSKSGPLSLEFNRILLSYLDDSGNLLEYEPIQNGVLWGIQRLAQNRPDRVANAPDITRPYLDSPDPEKRGLACLIAGYLNDGRSKSRLNELANDTAVIEFYSEGYIHDVTLGSMARKALNAMVGYSG